MRIDATRRVLLRLNEQQALAYLFLIAELESMRFLVFATKDQIAQADARGLVVNTTERRTFLVAQCAPIARTARARCDMLEQNALVTSDAGMSAVSNLCALMYKRLFYMLHESKEEAQYADVIRYTLGRCEQALNVRLKQSFFTYLWVLVEER